MSRWGVPLLRRWRRPRRSRLWPRRRQHQAQQDPPQRQRPLRRPLLRLQHRLRLPGRAPAAAAVAARLGPLRRHLPHRALPVEMAAMRRGQAPAPALGPKPPPRNRHKRRLLRPVAQRPSPVATARPQLAAKPVEPRVSPTRAPPRRLQGGQPAPAVPRRQPAAPQVARR